eukprot:TRINITY_DN9612_c5_g1_i1.p1 TRINITY_DN9612_c5_g1~~TRINITY_DN9612_c5_g1_i1.p1  ORF type:complete len:199 (+),score=38.10 TRINITY_DN9612_c5_g1_i1:34-597(+)
MIGSALNAIRAEREKKTHVPVLDLKDLRVPPKKRNGLKLLQARGAAHGVCTAGIDILVRRCEGLPLMPVIEEETVSLAGTWSTLTSDITASTNTTVKTKSSGNSSDEKTSNVAVFQKPLPPKTAHTQGGRGWRWIRRKSCQVGAPAPKHPPGFMESSEGTGKPQPLQRKKLQRISRIIAENRPPSVV